MKIKIAVFPGDGVGPELINEGIKVIEKAAELDKFGIEWARFPHGAEHYLETREELTEKALEEIKDSCNAVYCGPIDSIETQSVSGRQKPDEFERVKRAHPRAAGFLNAANGRKIPNIIRDYFAQFLSLRPIRLFPSVESPLANKAENQVDFVVMKENFEEFYAGASGRAKSGKNRQQLDIGKDSFRARFGLNIDAKGEIAYQVGMLSRKGCENVAKFAFEYAKSKNKKKVTAVDKANMLGFHNIWKESFESVSRDYKGIDVEFELIDLAAMNFIRQPEKYEVVAAPNMIGGILGDLGAALQGNLAFACRANINPEGISMFEPAHGSAAKLKGQGIVNPIAAIWAGALMLDSLGLQESSSLIIRAIEGVLRENRTRTLDLSGNNSTSEMGDAIVDKFIDIHD
jgi:3-isopropylmalate dehydrogenase